eukprot:236688-Prymnesium_polylepis.1
MFEFVLAAVTAFASPQLAPVPALRAAHVRLAMHEGDQGGSSLSSLFAKEVARQAAAARPRTKSLWAQTLQQGGHIAPSSAGKTKRGSPMAPGQRLLAREHEAARQDAAARLRQQASLHKKRQFGDFENGRLSELSGAQVCAESGPGTLGQMSMAHVQHLRQLAEEEAARAEVGVREAEAEAEAARVVRARTDSAAPRAAAKERASAAAARAARFLEDEVGALRLQVRSF